MQEKVTAEQLLMPVFNVQQYEVTNTRLKGTRPHMLWHTFYKGLEDTLQVTETVRVRSASLYGSRISINHCLPTGARGRGIPRAMTCC